MLRGGGESPCTPVNGYEERYGPDGKEGAGRGSLEFLLLGFDDVDADAHEKWNGIASGLRVDG